MKPDQKNLLPWFDAAAEVLFATYLAALHVEGEPSPLLLEEVGSLVRTRLSGLKLSSQATYRKGWNRWMAYARSRGLRVLPATEVGVLAWMRHDLCYTVQAKYFQPYLSALNKAHEHCGEIPVALGDAVADSRKSIALQQEAVAAKATRIRLPVEHVCSILDAALALEVSALSPSSVRLLRGSVAVCVDAAAGSRGNTGVRIRDGDVQLLGPNGRDGHVVRLCSLKGEVMVEELTGREKTLIYPPGAIDGLCQLIVKWESVRQDLGVNSKGVDPGTPRDSWYRLPGEEKTWDWNVDRMNEFLSEVLQALSICAPATFLYSWHSLRHMAASSQSAIGVADAKIMFLQNWASMKVALETYIDPLCPATAGCFRWYGWLLPPSLADLQAAAAVEAPAVFLLAS